jgi:hypothetical protein
VLVELTEEARARSTGFYAEHAQYGQELHRRYTEKELQLLIEFVRGGRELNERRAAEIERELQDGAA